MPQRVSRFRTTPPTSLRARRRLRCAAGPPPAPVASGAGTDCPRISDFALHVQAIRVGPPETYGYGVAESRDPATGSFAPTGTFRRGVRRAAAADRPGESLDNLPGGRDLLVSALRTLELHMRGVALVEFEIRDAELALLAARRVERPSPRTAIRLALDLAEAGVIDDVTAVGSIRTSDIESLLHPQLQLTGTRDGVRPWSARLGRRGRRTHRAEQRAGRRMERER